MGRSLLVVAGLVFAGCECSPPVTGPADAAGSDGGDGGDGGDPSDGGDGGAACPLCPSYTAPVNRGSVAEPALTENSGLVASRAHPGVLYAHNDSGDSARFFALSDTGAALGEFRLTGASASDWEDISLGPCPSGTCVYLGDIGDNAQVRTNYAVYRVAEPNVGVTQPAGIVSVAYERLPYTYPNNIKENAETLLVHPGTGALYILTKRASGLPSAVYRFPEPLTPGVSATLVKVADLPIPAAGDLPLTGGDLHPCGTALLLRTYSKLFLFELAPGASFETLFTTAPTGVPVHLEPQGEAVAWSSDGAGYYTASEGSAQPLWFSGCP
ncbi:MAG: hypothetical protein ACYC8T_15470 [Myxococcaceae bacterium]